jgi:hypothetical protein
MCALRAALKIPTPISLTALRYCPDARLTPARRQNFVVNAVESEFIGQLYAADGTQSPLGVALEHADTAFTVLFAAEVAINLYANFFRRFFLDGWYISSPPSPLPTPHPPPPPLPPYLPLSFSFFHSRKP